MHVCSIMSHARSAFGRVSAQELITYLADIEAQDNAADLIEYFRGSIELHQNPNHILMNSCVGDLHLVPVAKFSLSDSEHAIWETVTSLRLDTIEGFE